jgi:hypothetical protein
MAVSCSPSWSREEGYVSENVIGTIKRPIIRRNCGIVANLNENFRNGSPDSGTHNGFLDGTCYATIASGVATNCGLQEYLSTGISSGKSRQIARFLCKSLITLKDQDRLPF